MSPEELLDYLLTEYESEFVEFKGDNHHPENIGELVSALANGAVLEKKDEAYLIFGVDDSRSIVGTSFCPQTKRAGSMPFKNWVATNLSDCEPLIYFNIEHERGHTSLMVAASLQFSSKSYNSGSLFISLLIVQRKRGTFYCSGVPIPFMVGQKAVALVYRHYGCASDVVAGIEDTCFRPLGYPVKLPFFRTPCLFPAELG